MTDTTLPMTPIPIPPEAAASRPHLRAISMGPPPGVSHEECGTVESLAGVQGGYPVYADYWRPDDDQLAALNAGGFIELIQYVPRMVMHSMTVWTAARDEADPTGDLDVDTLRALLAAATPGPWEATGNDRIVSCSTSEPEGDPKWVAGRFGNQGAVVEALRKPDAALIAAAVNTLPELLDRLARVSALCDEWDGLSKGETATTRRIREALR